LELSDPGFDHTVLVEFRQRLLSGKQDLLLFDLLLTRLREGGYLKGRGRQRSDSTDVLAEIPAVETLRRMWVEPGNALIPRMMQKRTTRKSAPRVG
jgi:transposase